MIINKSKYVFAILIAIVVSIISTYLHHPETPVLLNTWGFKYNDIVYGVFNNRFSQDLSTKNVVDKWYFPEKYYVLTKSSRVMIYPYIDYEFEYPPVIGLIWFISTNLAIQTVLPEKYDQFTYRESYCKLTAIHYMVHAFVNSLALVLTVYVTFSIIDRIGKNYSKYRYLLYLLPSVVIYLVYNWDIICVLFLLLSLKNYFDKKWFYTGLFIGLSISTKILTVFIALAILIYLFRKKEFLKNIVYYIIGLIIATGIPFITMYLVSPRGFFDFINHHATWYCENCLYQLFIHDVFNPLHRVFAFISITLFTTTILYLIYTNVLSDFTEISLVLLTITIALNYVFSPQMMLLITPLAIIVLNRAKLLLYCIADSLNALIIILFFEDLKIRTLLNSIGLPVRIEFSPWSITSIIQWIAIIRILLLITIVSLILIRRLKGVKLVIVF